MTWLQATFELSTPEPEAVADALLEGAALAVDITDADAGTAQERPLFGEPGAQQQVWPRQRVTALFADGVDAEALVRAVLHALGIVQPVAVALERIATQDWVRATQLQFEPIRIGDRLWIVPSWCEPPDPDAINLRLDPGMAFGTGSHPTTWQCLNWLQANLQPGQSVLDYGCGSGVLAVAAKKLGAGRVVGVDIDPVAVEAARENARLNDAGIEAMEPDALPPGTYRVVLANILSNPLKMLAPLLASHCAAGGDIVLAGILTGQADAVAECYRPWFDMQVWSQREGWTCLRGSRTS